MLEGILEDIRRHDPGKGRFTIAIDGKCATGKTTLASRLAAELDADIIHMDDFFLPPGKRTAERLDEPGGNVDYERFREEVLSHLGDDVFSYRVFSCHGMDFLPAGKVITKRVVIVEGAYSLRPEMREHWDAEYILEAPLYLRLERIIERNGKEGFHAFVDRWIPLEDAYFRHYDFKGVKRIGNFAPVSR